MTLSGASSPVMQSLSFQLIPFIVVVVHQHITKLDDNAQNKEERIPLQFDMEQTGQSSEAKLSTAVAEVPTPAWKQESLIATFAFIAGIIGVAYTLLSGVELHAAAGKFDVPPQLLSCTNGVFYQQVLALL